VEVAAHDGHEAAQQRFGEFSLEAEAAVLVAFEPLVLQLDGVTAFASEREVHENLATLAVVDEIEVDALSVLASAHLRFRTRPAGIGLVQELDDEGTDAMLRLDAILIFQFGASHRLVADFCTLVVAWADDARVVAGCGLVHLAVHGCYLVFIVIHDVSPISYRRLKSLLRPTRPQTRFLCCV